MSVGWAGGGGGAGEGGGEVGKRLDLCDCNIALNSLLAQNYKYVLGQHRVLYFLSETSQ